MYPNKRTAYEVADTQDTEDAIVLKRIRVLTGANIWAYRPVLEALVDIGRYEELPSNKLPGFTEGLASLIPSLWQHRCSEGRPGGFFERLRLGTYMGHILEHVILELQTLAGMDVGFGRTRQASKPGEYYVVFDYKDAEAAKLCAYLARDLLEQLAHGERPNLDLQAELSHIREVAQDNMLGPTTQAIVDAARRRRIPWFRLDGDGGSLVQLGYGCFARRIMAAETSLTGSIATEVASDKELAKKLLDKVGVPVPTGQVVTSADDAVKALVALDCAVVVKPLDGNQGKAVSVNLTTEEQVRTAFEMARQISEKVIVERYLTGKDYRLLVVDNHMVAAAVRTPAQVVADGSHTIGELVEMLNSDPRRGRGHSAVLTRITMDDAAAMTLDKQGFTTESIPPAGQVVLLRDNSNLSTGGTARDVTDEVHPDNAELAVQAARTVGLDVAGIDIVCEDISRPLLAQGGGVVEVNAAPGLRMHVCPSEGTPRPVGDAIVKMLFPKGAPTRVPLIAVTGTNGKTTVTRMIAHIFSTMKKYVGMTNTDGVYFNGVCRIKGDCSGPRSAEAVLQHPMVEVAVLETARGGILRSGLGWDRSNVSVVLNVSNDHLGLDGIDTLRRMARVKRLIVERVRCDGYGVLNADDPLVADMAEECPGSIIFFGTDCTTPVMREHLAAGGKAVYNRNGGKIIIAEGSRETVLLDAADIPATYGGLIPFQVTNAMASAAAAWGAGAPLKAIRLGLRTFQADDKTAPGRFNVFEVGGAKVIVDYGHNPHALRAMQMAVRQMKPRRAIGVVTAPGDRRDEDIEEVAFIAAQTFDWVIVREDDDLRGRQPGEIARLIKGTIARANPSLPVCLVPDSREATDQALEMARPGDMAVIFVDGVEETIEQVKRAREARVMEQHGSWQPAFLGDKVPPVHHDVPDGEGKAASPEVEVAIERDLQPNLSVLHIDHSSQGDLPPGV
jgi:cyanophycin synthetase